MTSVKYQILFSELCDFHEIILNIFKETLKENYDEFDDLFLMRLINFQYTKKIDESKYLIGFIIEFDEIGTGIEQIINDLSAKFQDDSKIDCVFKFYDGYLSNFIMMVHGNLFKIEMKLREAISFIFLDTYKVDYYDFLRDSLLTPHFEGNKNLQKDKSQREDFLKKRFENEFFHILFDDYLKLTKPRNLKQEDLFLIAEISDNFDDFKKNIVERGITKIEYISFIEGIKQILIPIARIRNCVAHNRMLSTEDVQNYEVYFNEMNKLIDDFLEQIKIIHFCPKCGSDVEETQETIYNGHEEDQEPVAIKLHVGCKDCDYTIHDDIIDI